MLHNAAEMTIAGRRVGAREALYVIAEIGLNHGGSPERALQMVDRAAAAGASAVKLQTLEASKLVAPGCPAPAHVAAESLTDFFATFELDEAAHRAVAARAHALGLACIATPLSLESVEMLLRVGVDAFKIASGDLTWDGLIERVARTGRPVIMSTGMASLSEVSSAVATARVAGASAIGLLHCVSAYPVPSGSENLSAIATLGRSFELPVGLSDHASDTFAVPAAVALGASMYERHLMLDEADDAIDAAVSSTPDQFADVVAVAARTQAALGSGVKRCEAAEAPNLVPSRRSLYAAADLPAGHVLRACDLVALRPGLGLPTSYAPRLLGARLVSEVRAGEPLAFDQVGIADARRSA